MIFLPLSFYSIFSYLISFLFSIKWQLLKLQVSLPTSLEKVWYIRFQRKWMSHYGENFTPGQNRLWCSRDKNVSGCNQSLQMIILVFVIILLPSFNIGRIITWMMNPWNAFKLLVKLMNVLIEIWVITVRREKCSYILYVQP